VLNALWSWMFFGLHAPGVALVDIAVLWVMILLSVIAFRHVDRTASLLMIPYLAWVSYASVLNYTIWRLNS
jgi:translocator protein